MSKDSLPTIKEEAEDQEMMEEEADASLSEEEVQMEEIQKEEATVKEDKTTSPFEKEKGLADHLNETDLLAIIITLISLGVIRLLETYLL